MLDRTDDSSVAADNWLAQFEEALGKPDEALLKTLFHPDSYWRDVLALSWNLQTINGADAILKELAARAATASPRGFAIDPSGKYLLAAGQLSPTLAVYRIDGHTGHLAAIGKYPVGKGANWIEIVTYDGTN